tara:strand:- start:1593 stop:1799 length:207 start_codon:yes stop_codon:yes gene_type:complete
MSIINKANTKKILLQLADEHRPNQFNRVSKRLLDHIEMQQQLMLISIVKRHRSKGQTLCEADTMFSRN